jgi:hypothetical protein
LVLAIDAAQLADLVDSQDAAAERAGAAVARRVEAFG